jgi:tetratricopeptide (TPR) repeat protein
VLLLTTAAAVGFATGAAEQGGASGGQGQQSQGSGGRQGEVDYLGIAAVMIRDGNYERAAGALSNVDPTSEDLDRQRYFTLSGLLALRQGNNPEAISNFEAAIDEGQTESVLNVYLAQAYYAEGLYEEAISTIDRVTNLTQFPALYSILAESYWRLEERERAYDTLERASDLFPRETQFLRQQIFYLIDLDLTQEAADKSLIYLEQADRDPRAYVAIGEALRRGGNPELAVRTLEMARLLFGLDEQVHLALAQAYLDAGQPRNAGEMVERAAVGNPSLYYEAAEIYRRGGAYARALFLNTLVLDETRKAAQRFSLLLATERYEAAAALESRLERTGALAEDRNKYAMAFALFQNREYDRAILYLNNIESSDFFRQATELRRAIENVRESESFLVGSR